MSLKNKQKTKKDEVLKFLHDNTALYINLPFYKMKTLNQYQIIFREDKRKK
jgi:hypothetical protein